MKVKINKYDEDWTLHISMSYVKVDDNTISIELTTLHDDKKYITETLFEDEGQPLSEETLKDYFFEDCFLHDVQLNFEPTSDDNNDDVMTDYEFYKMKL